MSNLHKILQYFEKNGLLLTTAESCTAGEIIHLLAKIEGSGTCLDAGFVVYSSAAKKRLLGVRQKTIERYNLTSEEVALEMVQGAINQSPANVGVSTTGICGPDPIDGILPGTICFAWAFKLNHKLQLYSETKKFSGARATILTAAAKYALFKIPELHVSLNDRLSQDI